MTIKPIWRTKAMYIMFAFALVFGLVAMVPTIAPQQPAKAGIPPPVEKLSFGSEFVADFVGTPRVCETLDGCCVTFTNLTTGGVLPYQNASWDFTDGSLPAVGQAINYGETIEHCYTDCGTYTVTLTMWDGNSTEAYHVELDYITVTTMIPMLSWGDVTLNGAPAPEGTIVEIFVGDDTTSSGSGTVNEPGQYGVIPVCANASRYGEEFHYTVNDFPADKLGPDPGVFGAGNQEVNLAAFAHELAIRQLPKCEQQEQTFEVCITFNATDNDFNSIGLVDDVPPGWAIQVDTAWCSPNAHDADIDDNHVQYEWNGTYPAGASFTACYQVTVPFDAVFDTYTFSGELGYKIAGSSFTYVPIGGDSAVEVGDCGSGIRQLPECEQREQTFEVCITFNAIDEDFNSIGLVDDVPPGWVIQVDTAWCSPNAHDADIDGNQAQYTWDGPYPGGASFTACYQVTVPFDAVFDTYSFNGELGYGIAGSDPIFKLIGGDSAVEVGDCSPVILVTGIIREVDCDILPGVEIWLDSTGPAFSSGNGTYEIYAPETGTYNISATKEGFRDRVRTEYIGGPDPVNLDFQAAYGLIPCSPDIWYALECVNLWLYPPGAECALDMQTVLAVMNAWLYPGCP